MIEKINKYNFIFVYYIRIVQCIKKFMWLNSKKDIKSDFILI